MTVPERKDNESATLHERGGYPAGKLLGDPEKVLASMNLPARPAPGAAKVAPDHNGHGDAPASTADVED